jgi:phage replication-related protein YjqB (UPF0714/DUF867 family)
MNMGKYATYEELERQQREGIDYRIHIQEGNSGIAIVAPHGGGIELGTMEIAKEVAGIEHTFYGFEGIKATDNSHLHITSKAFDEPRLTSLVNKEEIVLSVHGCEGEEEVVYVGGLHKALKQKIHTLLSHAGFRVRVSRNPKMGGKSPLNICNRGRAGAGVQLEISKGLRRQMFLDLETYKGRDIKSDVFHQFVSVLRDAIAKKQVPRLSNALGKARSLSSEI